MNFNVHRRTNSLTIQNHKEKKEARSLKKVTLTPPLEPLFHQAKQIYQAQGDLTHAVKLFSQFLGVSPRHNEALYLCAVSELKLGQSQNALLHLKSISEEYHNKPNAMLLSAMALNKLGKVTESLEMINNCIQKYQGFEEAICFRGKLYLSLKYYQRAEQDFKHITSHSNASFLAYHSLGDCFRSQGKPDKAIGPYLKGLQLLGKQQNTMNLRNQMELKVGICLYQLEKWEQSLKFLQQIEKGDYQKGCQYYYYYGGCEIKIGRKEQGLLHLEYCLRVQGNMNLMKKAYKKLIEMYLQNYQFYEALNVVKLGDICRISMEGWGNVVQAFMLIIKGGYQDGVNILTNVSNQIKRSQEYKKLQKIKRQSSQSKQPRYTETNELRRGLLLSPAVKFKDHSKEKQKTGKLRYFSTKSVARAIPKIQSTRVRTKVNISSRKDNTRVQTEHMDKDLILQIYSGREKQLLYPFILLFKAYGQFFKGSYYACLETYEEYQSYIKDLFAKQSDVVYNKTLCQGLLMAQNDLHDDALARYGTCIDIYYKKHTNIPVQPLMYKIVLLVKLAIQQMEKEKCQESEEASSTQILESTLDFMENYSTLIGTHSLSLYFKGLIYFLLGKPQECKNWLDQGLKIADDCSWKWLWVKGAIQIQLGNYYQAVKQFSAGLILQNRPELFLGRSISFLLLNRKKQKTQQVSVHKLMKSVHMKQQEQTQKGQKENKFKNDLLVENCFEDLQKYIEQETNQQQISLWVSKILFSNGAFDQAIRSLHKITQKTDEVIDMLEAVAIYEGQFQDGGITGSVLQTAFQGRYLSEEEEAKLLHENIKKYQKKTFLDKDFNKWLVTLHLYVRKQYSLLLKFLQRELFQCEEGSTQSLLRYNVAILYLLLEEEGKAVNALKTLASKCSKISETLIKIQELDFDEDQCIEQLREEIGISSSKLLSNYLPFQPVSINNGGVSKRIYVRPSIPFPNFPMPSLHLQITPSFILEEVGSGAVDKKIEAPWIRRTNKQTVQFTQKLQQSGLQLEGETDQLKKERGSRVLE